jgi:hypothetical protein
MVLASHGTSCLLTDDRSTDDRSPLSTHYARRATPTRPSSCTSPRARHFSRGWRPPVRCFRGRGRGRVWVSFSRGWRPPVRCFRGRGRGRVWVSFSRGWRPPVRVAMASRAIVSRAIGSRAIDFPTTTQHDPARPLSNVRTYTPQASTSSRWTGRLTPAPTLTRHRHRLGGLDRHHEGGSRAARPRRRRAGQPRVGCAARHSPPVETSAPHGHPHAPSRPPHGPRGPMTPLP